MSRYAGYFLKFGGTKLPNEYLTSFSSTPNQRSELSAYRDNDNLLNRVTSPNFKTKITLRTKPLLIDEKINVQNIIAGGYTNYIERKASVTYYNDETDAYYTGDFYVPDVNFTVKYCSGGTILYEPVEITLIEY